MLIEIRRNRNCFGAALILLCLCRCAIASPEKYTPFADVPHGHWAYSALKQLAKAGVVRYNSSCYPSSHGLKYDQEHRSFTRYEFAVATQRALAVLKARKPPVKASQTAQQIVLRSAVNKLALEFKRELAQLNR